MKYFREFVPTEQKPLSLSEIKPMLKYQLTILKDHPEYFQTLIDKLKVFYLDLIYLRLVNF